MVFRRTVELLSVLVGETRGGFGRVKGCCVGDLRGGGDARLIRLFRDQFIEARCAYQTNQQRVP